MLGNVPSYLTLLCQQSQLFIFDLYERMATSSGRKRIASSGAEEKHEET
jgi:hypothetical protein